MVQHAGCVLDSLLPLIAAGSGRMTGCARAGVSAGVGNSSVPGARALGGSANMIKAVPAWVVVPTSEAGSPRSTGWKITRSCRPRTGRIGERSNPRPCIEGRAGRELDRGSAGARMIAHSISMSVGPPIMIRVRHCHDAPDFGDGAPFLRWCRSMQGVAFGPCLRLGLPTFVSAENDTPTKPRPQ